MKMYGNHSRVGAVAAPLLAAPRTRRRCRGSAFCDNQSYWARSFSRASRRVTPAPPLRAARRRGARSARGRAAPHITITWARSSGFCSRWRTPKSRKGSGDLQQDPGDVLGRGSGGDKGRGLVPIHVGSRHLIRVLEAEARKLERAPLNRQVIVATTRNYLSSRLKMDAHRSSLRPSPRERIGGMPASISHAVSAVAHAKTSAGTISVIIADSLSPAHLAEPASGLPELGLSRKSRSATHGERQGPAQRRLADSRGWIPSPGPVGY